MGARGAEQLRSAGHDVATIVEQGMISASDDAVAAACRNEHRCLVTLDLDFANPLRFPPEQHSGIAVLRPSGPATIGEIAALVSTFAHALGERDVEGRLWIVELGRIREYAPDDA